MNWHIQSSGRHTLTPKVSTECHTDHWQPFDISKRYGILSPLDRPRKPSHLFSRDPPSTRGECTKTLQYWQRRNLLPLLLLKIMPYWLSHNVKQANRILSTQNAPNTHKGCPSTASLGEIVFPICLLSLLHLKYNIKLSFKCLSCTQGPLQYLHTRVTTSVCRAAQCSGSGNLIQVKNTVYFLGPSYF